MITVLIACGANDLEVPCRIFENMEIGKQRCDELLRREGTLSANGTSCFYNNDLENDADGDEISKELFTSHYYGCGGVYSLVLKELDFDTKFIGFDLD